MGRLRRFPTHRFVGRRGEMVVYDCDDLIQFEEIESAENNEFLTSRNELQSFAPDTIAEARNRGFRRPNIDSTSGPPSIGT